MVNSEYANHSVVSRFPNLMGTTAFYHLGRPQSEPHCCCDHTAVVRRDRRSVQSVRRHRSALRRRQHVVPAAGRCRKYGVVRANDRAIVNLSVIDEKGVSVLGEVTGSTINLLSQTAPLQFSVINEGDAIYYVAQLRYTDQDVLRFRLTINVPNRAPMNLEFQQQMYVGGAQ